MSGKQFFCSTGRIGCQDVLAPPPAPSYPDARLQDSLSRLYTLERQLFALDRNSPVGLAAAQCRLLLLRYRLRIPVGDRELREARLALERFLGDQPKGVRYA